MRFALDAYLPWSLHQRDSKGNPLFSLTCPREQWSNFNATLGDENDPSRTIQLGGLLTSLSSCSAMIFSKGTCTKSGLLLRCATMRPFQGLVLNLSPAATRRDER